MSEEKKSIFRQKAMDRVSSPEELDHYLQVTSPGIWITLAMVIILLIGIFFWGIFGRLETNIQVASLVKDGKAICYISESMLDKLPEEPTVSIGEEMLVLRNESLAPLLLTDATDPSIFLAGELAIGEVVYPLTADTALDDGIYKGSMKVDAVTPISLIMN